MDIPILAIVITLLIAVVGLSFWAGRMAEKVRNNRFDIEETKVDLKAYQRENKEEHRIINEKLDTLIRNGHK